MGAIPDLEYVQLSHSQITLEFSRAHGIPIFAFQKNFIVVKKRTLKKTPCVSKRRFINLLKHCDGEADPTAYLISILHA